MKLSMVITPPNEKRLQALKQLGGDYAVHYDMQDLPDDFAALNKYVERCQSFLQAGKPDNDLLVYASFHDDWMTV